MAEIEMEIDGLRRDNLITGTIRELEPGDVCARGVRVGPRLGERGFNDFHSTRIPARPRHAGSGHNRSSISIGPIAI